MPTAVKFIFLLVTPLMIACVWRSGKPSTEGQFASGENSRPGKLLSDTLGLAWDPEMYVFLSRPEAEAIAKQVSVSAQLYASDSPASKRINQLAEEVFKAIQQAVLKRPPGLFRRLNKESFLNLPPPKVILFNESAVSTESAAATAGTWVRHSFPLQAPLFTERKLIPDLLFQKGEIGIAPSGSSNIGSVNRSTDTALSRWREILNFALQASSAPSRFSVGPKGLKIEPFRGLLFDTMKVDISMTVLKQSNLIVVSDMLLQVLNEDELRGVLAHEIGHYITALHFHSPETFRFAYQTKTTPEGTFPVRIPKNDPRIPRFQDMVNAEAHFLKHARVYADSAQALLPMSVLRNEMAFLSGLDLSEAHCREFSKNSWALQNKMKRESNPTQEENELAALWKDYLKCRGKKPFVELEQEQIREVLSVSLQQAFDEDITKITFADRTAANVLEQILKIERRAARRVATQYRELDDQRLAFASSETVADELATIGLLQLKIPPHSFPGTLLKVTALFGANEITTSAAVPLPQCLKNIQSYAHGAFVAIGNHTDLYHSACSRFVTVLRTLLASEASTIDLGKITAMPTNALLSQNLHKKAASPERRARLVKYRENLEKLVGMIGDSDRKITRPNTP